ncbi:hypothetical protein KP509_1Z011100 [Ceratopteris richardii]|nr:hypothetical protein KP509_1Z011100 [Ceratopteris richardii]
MALPSAASTITSRLQLAAVTPLCSPLPHCLYSLRSSKRHLCTVAASSEPIPSSQPSSSPSAVDSPAKKPVPTVKKGDIVRVDKEKYLNSVEYLAVPHPSNFKGLDYIYEDRGEILDVRVFETGEYALIGWAGIPTSPAWLPTYMLIKSEQLTYRRT